MKLEKGIISSSQFTLLIAAYVTGSVVTVTFASHIASHDNWLTVLGGFVISLPIILLYGTLAQTFPTQNLVQINDLVYGPYIGKLISLTYLFYIFLVLISNLRFIGDFILTYLLPETPLSVTILLFVMIIAWAVHSGIEVIARMVFPLMTVSIIFLVITIILLIKDMDPTYFLPIFEVPIDKFIHAVHIMLTIPFCEVVLFLLVFPSVQEKKRITRSYLFGFSIGAAYIFIVIVRNVATLGPYGDILTGPSYEAVRQINVGQFLTRLEVLFAIALIMMVFIRCSLLLYTTADRKSVV